MTSIKVVLGMSGGTDSSVAAILLQEKGYEVIGVTLNTWSPNNEAPEYIGQARNLANTLGIEHLTIDMREEFKKEVVQPFINSYLEGKTPSPCIKCNNTIKWKALLEVAQQRGAAHIATGHYVSKTRHDNTWFITKGKDPVKDQSYFLWNLSQKVLSKALFPLGELTKVKVKEIAEEKGFKQVARKKESMGVCFLNGINYRDFLMAQQPILKNNLANGVVRNNGNEIIGTHNGYPFYTIGQKRDLRIQAPKDYCVQKIIPETNTLIVGSREELYSDQLTLDDYLFPLTDLLSSNNIVTKIRGLDAVPPTPSRLQLIEKRLHINFSTPVWALTPGQPVVFYIDNMVIGGGFY